MPKFIKLRSNKPAPSNKSFPNSSPESTYWKLVLSNLDEFHAWCEYDATANAYAFLSLAGKNQDSKGDYTHLGGLSGREQGLATAIHLATRTAEQGTKVHPIIEVSKITDLRQRGILKALMKGLTVGINENGISWCPLDSFMKIWDCEIIETIEKEGFSFPIDETAISADILILENAPFEGFRKNWLEELAQTAFGKKKCQIIFNLAEKDERFVFKSIAASKNIFIQSEFQDEQQVSSFAKAFLSIERKNICLSTDKEGKRRIESHMLYKKICEQHELTIIE